jgi:molecular chaperone DnaK (HSP70)
LELVAVPGVLHIGHVAPRIGLKLTNHSCGTLALRPVSPFWIKLDQPAQSIPPQSNVIFHAHAATLGLKTPQADTISVETSAGSAGTLVLALAENPQLTVSPDAILFWPDARRKGRQRLSVELGVAAGGLRVDSVASLANWLNVTKSEAFPFLLGPGSNLRLQMEADADALAKAESKNVSLRVKYENPHGSATLAVALRFQAAQAPALRWAVIDPATSSTAAGPPVLWRMDKQNLEFRFLNQAERGDQQAGRLNAPIVLREVELAPEDTAVTIGIRRISALPGTLEGADSCRVEFEMNLETCPPGLHRFVAKIATDCPEVDAEFNGSRDRIVTLDVREVADFHGVVAIDFGTSNTCCAILPDDGELQPVELDPAARRATAPTVVRYLDLSGVYPEIETGALIKSQAASNAESAKATVGRLKQQLGEATHPLRVRPWSTREWVFREVSVAAGDYLHHIRLSAERARKVRFHRFILTHPAVCSIRQYGNLRSALDQAFGGASDVRVDFLQEPIAALIPFFDQRARDPKEQGYTVAAFDLGGGTTDVTVVQVQHRRVGEAVHILPTILTSFGERFGGENLTDFLKDRLLATASEVLTRSQPDFQVAVAGLSGASDSDVLVNEAALLEWAEILKSSLSEESGVSHEPPDLILRTVSKSGKPPSPYPFHAAELQAGENGALRRDFDEYCKQRIVPIAARLQQAVAGGKPLTYLQLSGKTVFLPVVTRTLKPMFSAKIERALDPKECVVGGACMFHSLAHGRLRRLIMPETQRTTSSIGLMDEEAEPKIFRPAILFDTPLTPSGVEGQLPNAWNGQGALVIWESLGLELTKVRTDGIRNPDLNPLGNWQPERTVELEGREWWPVRIHLGWDDKKKFRLTVTALGPNGEAVALNSRDSGGL